MNKYLLPAGVMSAMLCSICSIPAFSQSEVMADSNIYISGSAGYSFMNESEIESGTVSDDFDDTANFSIALGREFMPRVRGELELQYKESDVDSNTLNGDLTTWGMFANGYYDLYTGGSMVNPYLMGGIGGNIHDADITGADDSDTVFGWQIGGGLNFKTGRQTELFTGYRYQSSVDADIDNADLEYEQHELLAGVRWHFG
jgi:outer membrane immunogenic protein